MVALDLALMVALMVSLFAMVKYGAGEALENGGSLDVAVDL